MSTIRYFDGARGKGRISVAGEIMRIEIQKKGKLPAADRYKHILKRKLEESRSKALGGKTFGFKLPGSIKEARAMSKRAEQALKEIAAKKAAKEAKALRQMVIVEARRYPNGNITNNGKIYDVAGNLVAEVNRKNGKIATTLGWSLGKYKPKSYFTDINIQNGINNYSPYFINLRKQQLAQQQGVATYGVHGMMEQSSDTINVYGPKVDSSFSPYGSDPTGPRQNIGMTSWGARSDNVWGTYADNAWGNSMDNVWGGNSTDVWGGIGVGGLWGQKGYHVWGTGSGRNYLAKVTNFLASLLGLKNKTAQEHLQRLNRAVARGAGSSTRSSGSTATTRTAPAPRSGGH